MPHGKKVLVALPAEMLKTLDFIANCEHRTRSDLFREALRRYIDGFKLKQTSISGASITLAADSNNINLS